MGLNERLGQIEKFCGPTLKYKIIHRRVNLIFNETISGEQCPILKNSKFNTGLLRAGADTSYLNIFICEPNNKLV